MKYIIRDKSLLTDKNNLEHLYTFMDFPVFMGCVGQSESQDIKSDMVWDICRDTGLIQLRNLIPLDVLYMDQHNDGTGTVWQKHYQEFAEFIKKNNDGKNILEIGGAHDVIANNYFALDPQAKWTTVEPNPQYIKNEKIKIIKGLFDDKFVIDENIDAVIHSHVFEHVYQPIEFMQHISQYLQKGQKHIFTFPNMVEMLKKKFTNCLNFEHTVFLTEDITDYLLQKFGFKILDKQYYGNPHSIFYATEKSKAQDNMLLPQNRYYEYKKIFMDFVNYHLDIVNDINKKIELSDKPVYLFGAHIFSQYLIGFGLNTEKISNILDNSPIKIGKRLYGTSLMVDSPKILAGKGKVNIILKAGIYNEEIKKDILENVNQEVTFW